MMMNTGWALASFENGFALFLSNVYVYSFTSCLFYDIRPDVNRGEARILVIHEMTCDSQQTLSLTIFSILLNYSVGQVSRASNQNPIYHY
jgi:hypothetical protein